MAAIEGCAVSTADHDMWRTDDSMAGMAGIGLLDCTLRDGSYAVDFQFDEGFVTQLLRRLNETPVPMIEIGHGLGLEAERAGIRPGNIDHFRWSDIANQTLTKKPWGMFAQPEFTQLSTVAELTSRGMSFIRVGMEPDRVAENLDYIERATRLCPLVYLNLMKSSSTPVEQLPTLLEGVTPAITGVYVVDSYGAMLPADVRRYVTAVRDLFPVVGFHGHDNLGLANINTLAAWQAGARIVDGTLDGIGRGAGNAAVESLAAIVKVLNADLFDYREMAKLAEFCRTNMNVIVEDRNLQVLGGVIGVHSGFFPLVAKLAAECGTEPAHLMETAANIAAQSPRKADFHAAAGQIAGAALLRDLVAV